MRREDRQPPQTPVRAFAGAVYINLLMVACSAASSGEALIALLISQIYPKLPLLIPVFALL